MYSSASGSVSRIGNSRRVVRKLILDGLAQSVAVAQQAKQGQAEPEQEPQGIATKDGKHVIPYSVLKSERDRATRAEQLANEMQERVKALESMVQSGNQGAKQGESARTDLGSTGVVVRISA